MNQRQANVLRPLASLLFVGLSILAFRGAAMAQTNIVCPATGVCNITSSTTPSCPQLPLTLTVTGSFLLKNNINLPSGCAADAIDLNGTPGATANSVINLNGFLISGGTPKAGGAGVNILSSTFDNVTVSNGFVDRVGGFGLFLTGNNDIVEGTDATNGSSDGICVMDKSRVFDNIATGNTLAGILAGGQSAVMHNVASNNSGDGIKIQGTGNGGIFFGNAAATNTGFGLNVGTQSAYGKNTLGNNHGTTSMNTNCNTANQVSGGASMGDNICNGSRT